MRTPTLVARIQSILAILLLVALVMIGQRFSITIYTLGILLTLVLVVLGFTFNNIASDRPARKLAFPLFVTWVTVGGIFALAYMLAPLLVKIGS